MMLDINQLMVVLKQSKAIYDGLKSSNGSTNDILSKTLFDKSDNIKFTCFVNEFYYETDPNNSSKKVEDGCCRLSGW